MLASITARLAKGISDADDKAIYRILCGRRDGQGRPICGSQLGHLASMTPSSVETEDWSVGFDPGWVEGPDSTWQPSKRAQKQLHRANRQASTPWMPSEVRRRAQGQLASGTAASYRRKVGFLMPDPVNPNSETTGASLVRFQASRSTRLPCLVRCPKCNGINYLDLDLIRQANERFAREEAARFGR